MITDRNAADICPADTYLCIRQAHTVKCCLRLFLFFLGDDFTEAGFACVIEYLYTSAVQGATEGSFNLDKVQAAVQAANFFGMPKMAADCEAWATACGISQVHEA